MKNCWSKTILSVYRYLEKIVESIDRLIETRALYSRQCTSQNYGSNNVLHICEKITELTDRKVLLINLKLLCEKSLFAIDKKQARLLIAKYVDGRRSSESAELMGVCPRTYFRHIIAAEECFEAEMGKLGYSSSRLKEECIGEGWIMSVYNKMANTKGDEVFVLDKRDLERVYSDYRAASL